MADLLEITPTRLNYWEKGKREPDAAMIKKIAEVLEVSPNYLLNIKITEETKKEAPIKVDENFSKEEILLIKAYRAASEDDKAIVNCILRKYRTEGRKSHTDFSEEIC